jgi:hypothetical protein
MATIEEVAGLLQGLSDAGLEKARVYIESLKRQEAGAGPEAECSEGESGLWCYDFVDHFESATVSASRDPVGMECKAAEATCAGVTLPALWEHPPVTGSAMIGYAVAVPAGLKTVKLKFSVGIRDRSELPADQLVAFRVLVNGWKLWSTVKNSRAWEEHAIDMPEVVSDVVRVEFVTDGLGHHRWDWAVWGAPRLEGSRIVG